MKVCTLVRACVFLCGGGGGIQVDNALETEFLQKVKALLGRIRRPKYPLVVCVCVCVCFGFWEVALKMGCQMRRHTTCRQEGREEGRRRTHTRARTHPHTHTSMEERGGETHSVQDQEAKPDKPSQSFWAGGNSGAGLARVGNFRLLDLIGFLSLGLGCGVSVFRQAAVVEAGSRIAVFSSTWRGPCTG
jgi:hypothetical protein